MELSSETLQRLIVERRKADRFTQDSPVMPDVWMGFAERGAERLDLLLTPADGIDPAELAATLRKGLRGEAGAGIAYSASYAVATLSLEQLVRVALPLSAWWGSEREWLTIVLGAIEVRRAAGERPIEIAEGELLETGRESLPRRARKTAPKRPLLKRVTRNRPAEAAVTYSRRTVKADAVTNLFDVDCSEIAWAIVDTGIDATHPAFRLRTAEGELCEPPFEGPDANRTRVVATYDMTRLRLAHQAVEEQQEDGLDPAVAKLVAAYGDVLKRMRRHLLDSRPLDWDLLEPLLRVPHTETEEPTSPGYERPTRDHGTHVAGVLAAEWPEAPEAGGDYEIFGVCPNLRLYDLRVFPDDGDQAGDEFTVSAALQFIDHLNGYGRRIAIHGANVSLSVPYELSAFGCGQTPVCREANRLVASGVVLVAAAGNRGREEYVQEKRLVQGHRMISLTDPGNAEDAITVGSTHATDPHAYGVSHFSSRGPTADGRRKPDLVAPGEKIQAPGLDAAPVKMDGTSQAAPHVSGAAALLLARHRELIGKPQEVKRLLMESATDLGREPYFQGAGLVDALRAAQAN